MTLPAVEPPLCAGSTHVRPTYPGYGNILELCTEAKGYKKTTFGIRLGLHLFLLQFQFQFQFNLLSTNKIISYKPQGKEWP